MSLYIQIDKQRDQVVQLTEQQLPEDFIVLVEVLQAECVSASCRLVGCGGYVHCSLALQCSCNLLIGVLEPCRPPCRSTWNVPKPTWHTASQRTSRGCYRSPLRRTLWSISAKLGSMMVRLAQAQMFVVAHPHSACLPWCRAGV